MATRREAFRTPGGYRRSLLRTPGAPDRLLVVLSDIEMGAGGPYDDFLSSPRLAELILGYTGPKYDGLDIDLVFNGDTFDLLKTSHEGAYPHHISSQVAVAKMTRVADAHPRFFAALDEFLGRLGPRGRAYFIIGNHDPELLFPEVQELIRVRAQQQERLLFPGFSLDVGRVHIEHGAQFDPLFAVDVNAPFVMHRNEKLLRLSWASVALLDVAIPLQPLLYHHDRLKPKQRVLELIPEIRELLMQSFWSYWMKDYWRDFLHGTNPVKQVSWTMLKELVRRLAVWDPEVTMSDDLQRRILESDEFDVYLVGHQHEPALWSHGHRRVLRTGALRDEFVLSRNGHVQTQLPKSYAEVLMSGDEVVTAQLCEVHFPVRPRGTVPDSIFDVVPLISERLAPAETRSRERADQREQEVREAAEQLPGRRAAGSRG